MRERKSDAGGDRETTVKYRVEGMTCPGCERRIEEAAKKLKGVLRCSTSYRNSTVSITYSGGSIDEDAIAKALKDIGYGLSKSGAESAAFDLKQLLGIGVAIAVLFLVFQKTGLINNIPQVTQSMSYGLLFVVGLLTSLHCIAMCGGINLSQSIRGESVFQGDVFTRVKPAFYYNAGRVISYTVIGGIVGALGSVLSFSGKTKGFMVIGVGAVMILMGLNMLNIFPWLRLPSLRLFRGIGRKRDGARGGSGPFVVGLLNGFMPCGPLQAMQLYALGTGSFALGALSMFLFSVGTVPLMFGMGALSSLLSKRFAHTVLKVSAMLVLVLGIATLGRGMSLSGARVRVVPEKAKSIARIEGDVQVIQTELESNRYAPLIVQKGIPVRWTINARESSLNGCNNPVTIPDYDMVRRLVPGSNVIEFTPTDTGDIVYTCWMGMISSVIRVVDSLDRVTDRDVEDVAKAGKSSSSGGSCCSAGGGAGPGSGFSAKNVRIPTKQIGIAKIEDGIQYVSIDAVKKGYSPSVVVMQRGVPTKWTFNGRELTDDNYRILFPAYRAKVELRKGDNTLEFTPDSDFIFYSWKYSLFGYVEVVDNIMYADEREARARVERFLDDQRRNGRGRT
jgi:sulfite exporter TauE/SafE/copper chaperone CopZ